jgi:hypothetical protein
MIANILILLILMMMIIDLIAQATGGCAPPTLNHD